MMLEFAKRKHKDEKTIPGIFKAHREELQALAMLTCIQIILFEVSQLLVSDNPVQNIAHLCNKYAMCYHLLQSVAVEQLNRFVCKDCVDYVYNIKTRWDSLMNCFELLMNRIIYVFKTFS